MAGAVVVEENGGLGFEETELRLGLPGGGGGDDSGGKEFVDNAKNYGKRGFEETIDLKLKLEVLKKDDESEEKMKMLKQKQPVVLAAADSEKPSAPKAQVVGWPPVRSYRKNVMTIQSTKGGKDGGGDKAENRSQLPPPAGGAFVKVSMDGAPYLRKVDLKMYRSYQELSAALEKMFGSFTIGNCGSQGINFMNERKPKDLLNGSEYVPTFEDKDGDWMLAGDVPWEMFVVSCKRMRIMKGSEAVGLAPRAMEKRKNRS